MAANIKAMGYGLLLLVLAIYSASCSVNTQAEYQRPDRNEQFKQVNGEKKGALQAASSSQKQGGPANAAVAASGAAARPEAKTRAPTAATVAAPASQSQLERAPANAQNAPPAPVAPEAPALAAAPEPQRADASRDPLGKTFTLCFKRGSAEYVKSSQAEIREIAQFLHEHPEWKAVIEGYTDSRGDPETNLYLSNYRAQRLKKFLHRRAGIDTDRLEAKGYGAVNPVTDNETVEGRERNRRISVRFVRMDGAASEPAVAAPDPAPLPPAASHVVSLDNTAPPKLEASKAEPKRGEAIAAPSSKGESGHVAVPALSLPANNAAAQSPTPKQVAQIGQIGQRERASIPKAEDVTYAPLSEDGSWPAKRHYIEISVSTCTLSLYEVQVDGSKRLIKPYKVATAKKGTPYPEGIGMVMAIETNPWWFPTENMKRRAARRGQSLEPVPPGSKSNPMGAIKIHLSHENDGGSYRIHGTNAPSQIGRRVSLGCVRMHNNEGLELAKTISVGTEVNIVY